MITYYELLDDNTIGRSTSDNELADELCLPLSTERNIVYGHDGKRYFEGEEPAQPKPTAAEKVAQLELQYNLPRPVRTTLLALQKLSVELDPVLMTRIEEIEAEAQELRISNDK